MSLFNRKNKILIFIAAVILSVLSVFTGFGIMEVYADTASDKIYLGGMPAGFSLETRGAYVAGVCDVVTENGIVSPSKDAGIEFGDYILSIDGVLVNNASEVEKALKSEGYKDVLIDRYGIVVKKSISPAKDLSGKLRLGVFIKDSINGIGTITFSRGDKYASLGHPVLDDNGLILSVSKGKVYPCDITGYVKGEKGVPGELKGVFIKNDSVGSIVKNRIDGVYGDISAESKNFFRKKEIETGVAKPGKASIYTTIDGTAPKEYSISIIKVDNDCKANKNYVIKITDKELLEKTGGIIQGMSGSPIVQDGRLVGAVTHVFINDPTRGFGISVSNMLNNM